MKDRYLTEAEAWEVIAQIFAMADLTRYGDPNVYNSGRYGMCKTVNRMRPGQLGLISYKTCAAIRRRICDKLSGRTWFGPYVDGHDALRVKIARKFAKAAAVSMFVLCWLYPYGWVCVG